MRKLLILFCFLVFLFPMRGDSGIVIGDYYDDTVPTTCSSCTPGDPADIFCEDCENSGNFWCTWTADTIDSGNSVDCQNVSANIACLDKGAKAIQVFVDGDNGEEAARYKTIASATELYIHFYLDIVSHNGLDNLDSVSILWIEDTGTGRAGHFYLIRDGSGNYDLKYFLDGQGGDEVESTINGFTTGTQYECELWWKADTVNGMTMSINDTLYAPDDGETTKDVTIERIYVGSIGTITALGADEDVTFQVDVIEADDDTMSDDCPE